MHLHLLDPYRGGSSRVHALDPRVKIVLVLTFILITVLTPPAAFPIYPLLLTLIWAAAVAAELGIRFVVRRAFIAVPFALVALPLLVTVPGPPLAHLPLLGWSISAMGLVRAVSIVLKSWLCVQAAILLAATTRFTDLLWALRSLRVPAPLVAIVGFMYRYLFVLGDEALRLLRARAARSAEGEAGRSGGTLVWRGRVVGGMVGSLFLRSYERSERIYHAMVSRGYAGEIRHLSPPRLQRRDIALALLFLVPLLMLGIAAQLLWG